MIIKIKTAKLLLAVVVASFVFNIICIINLVLKNYYLPRKYDAFGTLLLSVGAYLSFNLIKGTYNGIQKYNESLITDNIINKSKNILVLRRSSSSENVYCGVDGENDEGDEGA